MITLHVSIAFSIERLSVVSHETNFYDYHNITLRIRGTRPFIRYYSKTGRYVFMMFRGEEPKRITLKTYFPIMVMPPTFPVGNSSETH